MGGYQMGDDPKKWCVYKEAGMWWVHPPYKLTLAGMPRLSFFFFRNALTATVNNADSCG